MGLTAFDRLYFIKSNIFILKDLHNFFSFSYLKIKVNYPWFTIEHRITPLYPQFCHIEQLTVPVEDFCIYSPEAACYLGLSEFQKGKILSQEHALFQVTQYLRHKTIVGWGGVWGVGENVL